MYKVVLTLQTTKEYLIREAGAHNCPNEGKSFDQRMLHLLTEAQPKQACGDNAAAYSNQSKQKLRAQIAPVRQNAFEGE